MKRVLKTIKPLMEDAAPVFFQCRNVESVKNPFFLLLTGLLLLTGSCQKEALENSSPVESLTTSSLIQSSRNNALPFKGGYETMETFVSIDGNIQHNRVTGIGEGTHIGRSTFIAEIQFDIFDFTVPITGIQTTTAADGSEIFSTLTGYATEPAANGDIQAIITETITGGTGRFASASGTFTVTANGNIYAPEGRNTFVGTISF